jgi:hypothetical protein
VDPEPPPLFSSRKADGRRQIHNGSDPEMLFRSTGLGKAELVAEIVDVKRKGDYLIMEMETTEPVRWKIRGGISLMDLRILLKAALKFSVLFFLIDLAAWFKKPESPGDF